MLSPLRDRDEFVIGAAILGTGLGVLNLAYASAWGWIPALLILPALIVRGVWRSMPGWLLLTWVTSLALLGEATAVTQSAYLVVTTALAVVAADRSRLRPGQRARRLDTVVKALSLVSPFVIWMLGTNPWHRGIGPWLWSGGLLIAWVFGHIVGQQWVLIDELERTRTKLAEAAVAEDRQRIARELHDLVGHSFSVVLLHLAGARLVLTSSPAAAVEALQQAETMGRRGMDELRQALMLMRQGTHSLAPVDAGGVERLVASYRDAGMQIDLDVRGDVDSVAVAPCIVLHDVLREALTNVAKHARAPAATIRIGIDGDHVGVRVESALRPAAPPATVGMGLTGLEQRVAAIDGTFRARVDHDRWLVEATLPRRLAGVPAAPGRARVPA
ncbi:sensor histidine kinase [Solwaraspora sp. WMMB335]|uniref:sensor histidine kinase n=1 Tax=Solwaraspora sp. WMMB335 TaxID=3404118 RepID=UPI003B94A5C2